MGLSWPQIGCTVDEIAPGHTWDAYERYDMNDGLFIWTSSHRASTQMASLKDVSSSDL